MSKNWRYNSNAPTNSKNLIDTEFLNHIKKSLYYSKLPKTDRLSLPVTELAAEFFTEAKRGYTLEKLDVEEASRISRSTCISPCTLVLALLYIERLKKCNPKYLQEVAPSELFLISLMVASKFLHDDGEDDEVIVAEWAISGKITVTKIKELEKDFLSAIDWTVFVRQQDFWKRLQQLETDVARREIQKRGWCTYTELNSLMNHAQLFAIARTVMYVSYVCLAAYVAGVITLLGSCLVAQSTIPTISLSGTSPSSEFARQPPNCIFTAESIAPHSSMVVQSHGIDNQLPIVVDSLIRDEIDQNVANLSITKIDDGDGGVVVSWQWWLNSTMTWLPEYCGLKNVTSKTTKPLADSSLFVSDSKFSFNLTRVKSKNGTTDAESALDNYHRYYANWKNTNVRPLGINWHDIHVTKLSIGRRLLNC